MHTYVHANFTCKINTQTGKHTQMQVYTNKHQNLWKVKLKYKFILILKHKFHNFEIYTNKNIQEDLTKCVL